MIRNSFFRHCGERLPDDAQRGRVAEKAGLPGPCPGRWSSGFKLMGYWATGGLTGSMKKLPPDKKSC